MTAVRRSFRKTPAPQPQVSQEELDVNGNEEEDEDSISLNTGLANPIAAFTLDTLKDSLPKNFHSSVTTKLLDDVNNIIHDEDFAALYRDTLITYQSVLLSGKYTVDNYLDAVSFCSFKFMGMTDKDAYANAFPHRVKRLKSEGKNDKTISAYVCAYAKGKLVVELLNQATIPNYLLYRDVFHKAVMTQAKLMTTANSELVRTQAANSLLSALKQPEVSKMQISATVDVKGSAIESLAQATQALVAQQQEAIRAGRMSAKGIAESRIVEAEYVEA